MCRFIARFVRLLRELYVPDSLCLIDLRRVCEAEWMFSQLEIPLGVLLTFLDDSQAIS